MHPAHVIEIVTPQKVRLHGLWLGPRNARRVVVWVHGLGSSLFSRLALAGRLVDAKTAVLVFNNRGHDGISSVTKGRKRQKAGAAHERFTDCADDIQGAVNFARRHGARDIFLAGHSTGCQKSVYWAIKRGRGVKGIVLLAPISDYSAERHTYGRERVERAVSYARAMMRRGKGNDLLPSHVWDWPWSAQRYLSLFSGKSQEELFPYWNDSMKPRALRSVRIPMLVVLAGSDEHEGRPAKQLAVWFRSHVHSGRVCVISRADHGFKGKEGETVREMRTFMRAIH